MSIAVTLASLQQAGVLRRFVARSRRPSLRRLYLTHLAWDQVTNPRSNIGLIGLLGEVEAAMAHWTLGDLVYADGRGEPSYLKRLEAPPPEVWNIRVTQPSTQARLFGRFVVPNALIITHAVLRGDLSRKGKRSPKKWTAAMNACVVSWNGLGLGAPFSGASVHDYVTENCDDFSI